MFRNTTIILILYLFTSCSGDVNVNFKLNGEDIEASLNEPFEESKFLEIFTNDSILLTDHSIPLNKVKSRQWDVNGDGLFDKEYEDKEHFPIAFANEGIYSVKFCINESENCVRKWLKVNSGSLVEDEFAPKLTFLSPSSSIIETEQSSFPVEVKTANIFSKEELLLLVNGRKKSFDFDADMEMLSKKIMLREGKNKIEIIAQIDGIDSDITEEVEINYNKGYSFEDEDLYSYTIPEREPIPTPDIVSVSRPVKTPVNTTVSNSKPVNVEIVSPKNNQKTDKGQQEIAIKSSGLMGQKDLKIELNQFYF